uniref:Putative Rep n=1 Tax=Pteris mastrevirus A TaxID=2809268 RepID=A0A890CAZ4_9GEMI|nr:putative Rep [Pteris mastrevirus A]
MPRITLRSQATPPINFQGKTIFLTYPQCNLTPQQASEHLNTLLATRNPIFICRWKHTFACSYYHVILSTHSQFQLL